MEKYVILGHENPDNDSIVSGYLLEKYMKKQGYDVEFIIPDKKISDENIMLANYVGINTTSFQKSLPKDSATKYILVDHHERKVPGEIVAIIDHHPTDKKISCKYYRNEQACSTSCMIVKGRENHFSLEDIKATRFSAMVDTAAFHSNKTTISDYLWIQGTISKFKFDYDEMQTISMCPTDIKDLKKASLNGLKKYNLNGHRIASSFLHLLHPIENKTEIETIINYLKKYIETENYELFAFIVHDITNFKTRLYKIKLNSIEITDYNEYTSRGNRIIPDINKELTSK